MVAEDEVCFAGRKAFFGGRWRTVCLREGIHRVGAGPNMPEVRLCDEHFQQVLAAGLVSNPYLTEGEYEQHWRSSQGPSADS